MKLHGLHVLILGLGESGLAMARWCVREGAHIHVADTRTLAHGGPPQLVAFKALYPEAAVHLGAFDASLLDGIDMLAISPGLSPLHAPQKALLEAAAERHVPVCGEIELFAQKLAALKVEHEYQPQVIAITGTNGKTTVTSLVGKLCQRAGLRTCVAGNISPSALDALSAALDGAMDGVVANVRTAPCPQPSPADAGEGATPLVDCPLPHQRERVRVRAALDDENGKPDQLPINQLPQVWVLELSSFQLATCSSLAPDAATVLNLTQDHLDWHGDMVHYGAAKARIFAATTTRILNRDDARVMQMADVNTNAKAKAPIISFGLDAPAHTLASAPHAVAQFGVLNEGGMRWLACAEADDELPRSKRPKKLAVHVGNAGDVITDAANVATYYTNDAESFKSLTFKRLMPAEALQIRGDHNIANALAALALCRAIGLPMAPLLHGLREYRGEAHRVELVSRFNEVEYFDDSKGTNVGATVAALHGLAGDHGQQGQQAQQAQRRIVLIAGGDGKGQDFAPLALAVALHARAVFLIGKDAALIRTALADCAVPLHDCATLQQAVAEASALARSGDIVLLSPACASLDMFRDYKQRAQVFIEAVRELALEAGQPC